VRGVTQTLVDRVVIECATPMVYHVDGDAVQGGTRLEGRAWPRALAVCCGSLSGSSRS
jgi:diacylglycerol kinase family enzyme